MYKDVQEHGPDSWLIDVGGVTEILFADYYKLELTSFDSLSTLGVAVVTGSLVASAVVGSYCKSAIYQYMYQRIKEIGIKPFDILILVNTVTQHVICLYLVIVCCMGLLGDIRYGDQLGEMV